VEDRIVKHPILSFGASVAVVAILACGHPLRPAAAQHPGPAPGAAPADPGAATGTSGKVVETMNSGGYTYVQVDDGSKKIWAAAPQFTVAVGDMVVVPEGMPMDHFESKTLGRTFDLIYFVPGVQVFGGKAVRAQVAAAHGGGANTPAAIDLSNIKKADGGQTVGELFSKKAALTGKEVAVRGRVVKFTPAVMGKNWIHVQDGTGSSGSNDLTVSTSATAAVGNLVVVRGTLVTDRDLGAGYHYDVIIEDGTVTVE
jgi:hypothetical protein